MPARKAGAVRPEGPPGAVVEGGAPSPRPRAKAPPGTKRINLALQGGGAHGAFTWGVLDRLLEDGRLDIEAVVGTSAGAMNATVLAYGIAKGGLEGGREALADFWTRTGEAARRTPFHSTPLDRLLSPGNLNYSPVWQFYDALTRTFSPYQLNPLNINPLRDVLNQAVDFEALRRCDDIKLFLCATNVLTGKIKVFDNPEITADHVLASSCLPHVFQAVEIGGEYFWDGGFMGNPPIYPLIYATGSSDVLIVQINPIRIKRVPKTTTEILDRINELSFNSSLMREMRSIYFVSRLLDEHRLDAKRYKRLLVHTVGAEEEMAALDVSSKLNADPGFLKYLFDLGRDRAGDWLDAHYDKVGRESSTDVKETFL